MPGENSVDKATFATCPAAWAAPEANSEDLSRVLLLVGFKAKAALFAAALPANLKFHHFSSSRPGNLWSWGKSQAGTEHLIFLPPALNGQGLSAQSGSQPRWLCSKRAATCGYGSKFNHQKNRRFLSLVPFTRVPFWVPIFDPQPCIHQACKQATTCCSCIRTCASVA